MSQPNEVKKDNLPYLTAADMQKLKETLKKAREEVKKHPEKYKEFSQ